MGKRGVCGDGWKEVVGNGVDNRIEGRRGRVSDDEGVFGEGLRGVGMKGKDVGEGVK